MDDLVDELGSRQEIEYIHTMLRTGTSADRQLAKFKQTGDMNAVVDMLSEETFAGC